MIKNDSDSPLPEEQLCDQILQQVTQGLLAKRDAHKYDVTSFVADPEVRKLLQILLDLPNKQDYRFLKQIQILQENQHKIMQTQHRTYREVREMQDTVDYVIDYLQKTQLQKVNHVYASEQELAKIFDGGQDTVDRSHYLMKHTPNNDNVQEHALMQKILLGAATCNVLSKILSRSCNKLCSTKGTAKFSKNFPSKKKSTSSSESYFRKLREDLNRLRSDIEHPRLVCEKANQTSKRDSFSCTDRESSYHDATGCNTPVSNKILEPQQNSVFNTRNNTPISVSSSQIRVPEQSEKSGRSNRSFRSDSSFFKSLENVVRKTVQDEFQNNVKNHLTSTQVPPPTTKRPRGRPKGSTKNKPKNKNNLNVIEEEDYSDSTIQDFERIQIPNIQKEKFVQIETDETNIPQDYYSQPHTSEVNITKVKNVQPELPKVVQPEQINSVQAENVVNVDSNANNVRFNDNVNHISAGPSNLFYDEQGNAFYLADSNVNNVRRAPPHVLNATFDWNDNEVDIDRVRQDVRQQFQIPDDQGLPEAIANYVQDGIPVRPRPAAHSTLLPAQRQQATNSFGFTPQDMVLGQTTPQSLRPPNNAMANTRIRVHPDTGKLTMSRGTNVLEHPVHSIHPASKSTSGLRELEGPKAPDKNDNFDKMVPKLKGTALSVWSSHIERLLASAGYVPPYHPDLKFKILPLILNKIGPYIC